MANFLFDTEVS